MLGSAAFRTGVAPGGALAGPWVRNPLWTAARAVPSLDLRFADNKSLVDATTGQNLVTFTRASSGTYVDSQGVIRTATTNLLLRSEEFETTWTTNNASISTDSTLSPNGQISADSLIENTANAQHNATQTVALPDSTVVTVSVYAKSSGRNWMRLSVVAKDGTVPGAYFDLSTGSTGNVISSPIATSIISVGNGWYRCSVTASTNSGATLPGLRIWASSANGTITYTGNGTSGIYLWGAQLEQSSTVGEYIPTTSTINSAPRFDHAPTTGESLGLLVEESRTNNVLQSEDFATTWTASNLTVTTNSVVAPDGTTTADTIAPPIDGLTVTRFLRQNPVLTTQQAYTFSVFVKVGTATTNGIGLYIADGTATNNFRSNFNLFNLTTSPAGSGWATPTATIIPYPNGWYRCILSGVTSTTHGSLRAQIYLSAFTTVADTYGSMHIWGAQLEAGAFPTSYIPTTTATATRSADVASITGSNWSSWGSSTTGTYYLEAAVTRSSASAAKVFLGASASPAESYYLYQVQNQSDLRTFDSTSVLDTVNTISDGVTFKGAAAYSSATLTRSLVLDGGTVTEGAFDGTYGTDLSIGSRIAGGAPTTGTIRRLTYFPTRLANETLQRITQ